MCLCFQKRSATVAAAMARKVAASASCCWRSTRWPRAGWRGTTARSSPSPTTTTSTPSPRRSTDGCCSTSPPCPRQYIHISLTYLAHHLSRPQQLPRRLTGEVKQQPAVLQVPPAAALPHLRARQNGTEPSPHYFPRSEQHLRLPKVHDKILCYNITMLTKFLS